MPAVETTDAPAAVAPPPGHPRFPLVDSMRGIAALTIVLAHASRVTGTADGPWGVVFYNAGQQILATFFLVSGFLLYRPYVNAQINGAPEPALHDYLRRRMLRIIPGYWLALTLFAIYPGLPGVFTEDWWKFYLFLNAYSEETVPMGLLVAWTLCIEITFYLFVPIYVAFAGRVFGGLERLRRVRAELTFLGLAALASILLRYVDYTTAPTAAIQNSLLCTVLWFAFGMSLAVISAAYQGRENPSIVRRIAAHPGLCWAIGFGIFAFIMAFMDTDGTYSVAQWILGYYVLGGVMCLFLFMPSVFGQGDGGWPRRVLAWPFLAWAGLLSYGIYLGHVPLEVILFDHGITSFPAVAVGGLVLAVAYGAASYYLFERPILRFKYLKPKSPFRQKDPGAKRAPASAR